MPKIKYRDANGNFADIPSIHIKSNYDEGYEAGRQAEHDAFWDVLQNNGNAANYYYAFAYGKFTDENYKPKYDIVCSDTTTGSMAIFYASEAITDTKVPITLSRNAQSAFYSCTGLKTIRKLIVNENTTFTTTFGGCTNLENITIEGVIGTDFDIKSAPLTHDSIMSIINALKDYSGTSATVTLGLGTSNLEKLTENEKAIATERGWTLV